jgi:hypothetical protein
MCTSSPDAPKPPPRTPEAAQLPTAPTIGRGGAAVDTRRRRAATGADSRSTILTGARGVQDGAATSQKTLLGQ